MRTVAEELTHEVVGEWIYVEEDGYEETKAEPAGSEKLAAYALRDIEDVARADILVLFSEKAGSGSRGGKDVEFGVALALGKPLIVLGGPQQIFHHLPQVYHISDTKQLQTVLDELEFIATISKGLEPDLGGGVNLLE